MAAHNQRRVFGKDKALPDSRLATGISLKQLANSKKLNMWSSHMLSGRNEGIAITIVPKSSNASFCGLINKYGASNKPCVDHYTTFDTPNIFLQLGTTTSFIAYSACDNFLTGLCCTTAVLNHNGCMLKQTKIWRSSTFSLSFKFLCPCQHCLCTAPGLSSTTKKILR